MTSQNQNSPCVCARCQMRTACYAPGAPGSRDIAEPQVPLDPIAEVVAESVPQACSEAPQIARDAAKKRPSESVAESPVADAKWVRQFRRCFSTPSCQSDALADLMAVYPTTYDRIVAQTESAIYDTCSSPYDLYRCFDTACSVLTPDELSAAGGAIGHNDCIRHIIISYMRYCSLRENGGRNTSTDEIVEALGAPLISTKAHDQCDGAAIDAYIGRSCFPRDNYKNLSVEKSIEFLTDLVQNLSAYSAERCAAILIKLARIFVTTKSYTMVSALASTPFVGALSRIHRVVDSNENECTAEIV